jgi:hypothetical protein
MRWGRQVIFTIAIGLAACNTGPSGPGDGEPGADASPIKVKTPPQPKEGTGTNDACEGVTARGECREGVAVYCDLQREAIRKIDCKAQSRDCLVDSGRGAICKELAGSGAPPPDPSSECESGVTPAGFCTGTTAVWCDETSKQTVAWDCATENLTCQTNACRDGSYCCTADGGDPPSTGDGGTTDECNGLDFDGVCDGDVAKWCQNGKPQQLDCNGLDKRCEVDTCAQGAFCCGSTTTSECDQLGLEGECNGNTLRFCLSGNIFEASCVGSDTCQEDTCFSGAACCPPTELDECQTLGFDGVCDGETVRYCDGEQIIEYDCLSNEACEVDTCFSGGAECCEQELSECEIVGVEGVCEGNTLKYCSGDNLTVRDCTATGKTCDPDGCFDSGLANCCTP